MKRGQRVRVLPIGGQSYVLKDYRELAERLGIDPKSAYHIIDGGYAVKIGGVMSFVDYDLEDY